MDQEQCQAATLALKNLIWKSLEVSKKSPPAGNKDEVEFASKVEVDFDYYKGRLVATVDGQDFLIVLQPRF